MFSGFLFFHFQIQSPENTEYKLKVKKERIDILFDFFINFLKKQLTNPS